MPKVEYENVIYDSQEELDFKHWLDEAYDAELIESYQKCEKGRDTFELIGKQYYTVQGKKKHCFASVEYTPDYFIKGFESFKDKPITNPLFTSVVDIKGGFSKFNDNKQFQIIRKMMKLFKGIYVQKIIPDELFQKTWVPEKCRYTDKQRKLKKKFKDTPTIKDYLKCQKLERK